MYIVCITWKKTEEEELSFKQSMNCQKICIIFFALRKTPVCFDLRYIM